MSGFYLRKIAIITFCVWIATLLHLHISLHSLSDPPTPTRTRPLTMKAPSPVLGTYARFSSVEVVYALPSTTQQQSSVTPIALLLHSCSKLGSGLALTFFSPSSSSSQNCPQCVGLPEEIRMTRLLLERGYAVLAISSSDRITGCWGVTRDTPYVRSALTDFQKTVLGEKIGSGTKRQRVVAIGVSSGGRMAAYLASVGIADAALVMVMDLGSSLTNRFVSMGLSTDGDGPDSFPPLYLAPMPRDERTTNAVRNDYRTIVQKTTVREEKEKKQGDTEEGQTTRTSQKTPPVVLDDMTCASLPVTKQYLYERVPGLSLGAAEGIVRSLQESGHIGSSAGSSLLFLQKDPTRSNWPEVLKKGCGEDMKEEEGEGGCLRGQVLERGHSPLAKALHRAWAYHEYCSEVITMAIDFFERELMVDRDRTNNIAKIALIQ